MIIVTQYWMSLFITLACNPSQFINLTEAFTNEATGEADTDASELRDLIFFNQISTVCKTAFMNYRK